MKMLMVVMQKLNDKEENKCDEEIEEVTRLGRSETEGGRPMSMMLRS